MQRLLGILAVIVLIWLFFALCTVPEEPEIERAKSDEIYEWHLQHPHDVYGETREQKILREIRKHR